MNDLLKELNMEPISEFFDECYEKALSEKELPIWLKEEFIKEAAADFPFLTDNLEEVLSALPEVVKNEKLVLFAKTLFHMLKVKKHHEEVFMGLKFPKAPKDENPLGYDMFSFYPMFARIWEAYKELRAKGADEEVLNITAKGVGGSLNASSKLAGRLAFIERYFLWCTTHKNGSLFKIGRFSFEIRDNVDLGIYAFRDKKGNIKIFMKGNMKIHKSGFVLGSAGAKDEEGSFETVYNETEEFYEGNAVLKSSSIVENSLTKLLKSEWELIYSPKDTLISVHIPKQGSFDEEFVNKSLEDGREFLKKLYPEKDFKAFMCISWLLAPELFEFLKPTSNILSFSKRFERFPVLCEGLDVFIFVFTKSVSSVDDLDFDSLPENSSLEKNLKNHYKSGKFVHETGGIIPF